MNHPTHVNTPESLRKGNEHLAAAANAYDRAVLLSTLIVEMESTRDKAYQDCRSNREAAARCLLGDCKGFRGY